MPSEPPLRVKEQTMKFPDFPNIEGYPCTDPDMYWGYACNGHVDLREFLDRCCDEYAYGGRLPSFVHHNSSPGHAFVRWHGFGGWNFCFPDDRGAKPITFWNADGCSYDQWLMQMLKDICHREHRDGDDAEALRIVHLLQLYRYSGYGPAIDSIIQAAKRKD